MIPLLLKLPLVLAMAVPVAWGASLYVSGDSATVLTQGVRQLAKAYPIAEVRRELLDRARRVDFAARGAPFAGKNLELLRSGIVVATLHAHSVLYAMPVYFALHLTGFLAGLAARERLREGRGYASPTVAYLARGLVAGGTAWLVLFALSPVDVSYSSIYLSALLSALGGAFFVANLPLRL